MLLLFLVAATLFALLGIRVATSPIFQLLGQVFASWAERCAQGPELAP